MLDCFGRGLRDWREKCKQNNHSQWMMRCDLSDFDFHCPSDFPPVATLKSRQYDLTKRKCRYWRSERPRDWWYTSPPSDAGHYDTLIVFAEHGEWRASWSLSNPQCSVSIQWGFISIRNTVLPPTGRSIGRAGTKFQIMNCKSGDRHGVISYHMHYGDWQSSRNGRLV